MDRIQIQASKLWELLFSDDTADTYQTTLNLTGTIIKESAQLIWLIICSVFVFGAWFGNTSVKTGQGIRDWVDQQSSGEISETDGKAMTETGKDLLETGRTGISYLLNQAREQLGLEAQAPAIKPAKPAASKTAPTTSKPSGSAQSKTPSAAAATAKSGKPTTSPSSDEVTREPFVEDQGYDDD